MADEPTRPDYAEIEKVRFPWGSMFPMLVQRAIWLENELIARTKLIEKIGCLKFHTASCQQVSFAKIYWCEICKWKDSHGN